MLKIECAGCGGALIEQGRFLVCENCGTKYALGKDDEGKPFTYRPIEKKDIEFGQIGAKASSIKTEAITVKEIKLADNIDADIHRESVNLEKHQSIQIISRFIMAKEWDAAQTQINQLLLNDHSNAEARWYGMMCERHLAGENELINSFASFSTNDSKRLDDIISNSTPSFAKHIMDLLFEKAVLNDNMCFLILSVILPYAKNDAVYSNAEYCEKARKAINLSISKTFEKSFDYLLKSTLSSDDVDLYIRYNEQFGDNCSAALAQKYYSEVARVDPGNVNAHRKLVISDIRADSNPKKTTADFEELLKYTTNTDAEVLSLFSTINSQSITTPNVSQFVWQLIGYYSESLEALKSYIMAYADILLQSSLWTQAREYSQLVLSIDVQNADAYWNLCLARLQAKSEKEIVGKKSNIIECPEFAKAVALYQSQGNSKRADELMSYTQKQRALKKNLKIGVGIIAAIILLIIAGNIFNAIKYTANVSVSFTNESLPRGWEDENIEFVVKNNGFVDIWNLTGVMSFYSYEGKKLASTEIHLYYLSRGEDKVINLSLDSGSASDLDYTTFSNLKITFAIKEVVYKGNKTKDFGDGKEKTIKKAKDNKEEREALQKKFDSAMKAYDQAPIRNDGNEAELVSAVELFDLIWDDIMAEEKLRAAMYKAAENYTVKREYEKAYYMYGLLTSLDYKDSAERMNDIYYKHFYY